MATKEKLVSLITTAAVVLSKEVLDEKGQPLRSIVKHNSRDIMAGVFDHEHIPAGTPIKVSKEIADELIARFAARKPAAAIDFDDEGDDDV